MGFLNNHSQTTTLAGMERWDRLPWQGRHHRGQALVREEHGATGSAAGAAAGRVSRAPAGWIPEAGLTTTKCILLTTHNFSAVVVVQWPCATRHTQGLGTRQAVRITPCVTSISAHGCSKGTGCPTRRLAREGQGHKARARPRHHLAPCGIQLLWAMCRICIRPDRSFTSKESVHSRPVASRISDWVCSDRSVVVQHAARQSCH